MMTRRGLFGLAAGAVAAVMGRKAVAGSRPGPDVLDSPDAVVGGQHVMDPGPMTLGKLSDVYSMVERHDLRVYEVLLTRKALNELHASDNRNVMEGGYIQIDEEHLWGAKFTLVLAHPGFEDDLTVYGEDMDTGTKHRFQFTAPR